MLFRWLGPSRSCGFPRLRFALFLSELLGRSFAPFAAQLYRGGVLLFCHASNIRAVLAGEPNGQIVLVLRPTSAVPDEMQMGRQFPTSIEGPDSRNSRLWLELWAGFAQKKSGPGSPSPERVQGRLQQLCLSCSSTTLSSPSPFVNGTNDVRTGSDVLHAMCFAVPKEKRTLVASRSEADITRDYASPWLRVALSDPVLIVVR